MGLPFTRGRGKNNKNRLNYHYKIKQNSFSKKSLVKKEKEIYPLNDYNCFVKDLNTETILIIIVCLIAYGSTISSFNIINDFYLTELILASALKSANYF